MDSAAASGLTPMRRWVAKLEAPVDGASLAVFRIVFGLAMAVDAWRYLAYGWVDILYVRPLVRFHYIGFGWLQPWPGSGMRLHFWAISVLALLVAAGLFYRVAMPLLFAAYLYLFLLDPAAYMNHHYLMLLLALLLAGMPANREYSFDRLLLDAGTPGAARSPLVPQWTVWVLRLQLVLVYIFGAVAKLDPDWLQGEPMRTTLRGMASGYSPALADIAVPVLAYAVAYLGLLADLAIPAFLLSGRTRWLGFIIAAAFHGANAVWLNIGVFSYLMLGMLPIFCEPDWPRRLPGARRLSPAAPPMTPTRPVLLALLHVYVVVQLLLPLRHWLYPGPVRWTEEGHRFAWRMMLRTKRSQVTLHVTDPTNGRTWQINPANDLTSVQLRELETYPDLLLQYVHFHRDRLRREGIAAPEIRVDWQCSLNGRPPQALADPTVDLARVEPSVWPARWLLPLDDADGRF